MSVDHTEAAVALALCIALPDHRCMRLAKFLVDGVPMCSHHKRQAGRRFHHGWRKVEPKVVRL